MSHGAPAPGGRKKQQPRHHTSLNDFIQWLHAGLKGLRGNKSVVIIFKRPSDCNHPILLSSRSVREQLSGSRREKLRSIWLRGRSRIFRPVKNHSDILRRQAYMYNFLFIPLQCAPHSHSLTVRIRTNLKVCIQQRLSQSKSSYFLNSFHASLAPPR